MELQSPNLTSNNSQNPKNDPPKHVHLEKEKEQEQQSEHHFFEDMDSTSSTPYVSAPSSPGRGSGSLNGGFYYSAPASPMHFALTASYSHPVWSSSSPDNKGSSSSVAPGFEFGSGTGSTGSMSSADELFLNGKIRPMKLSSHLERPQVLAPLLDLDEEEECNTEVSKRGRDIRIVRDKSMRRRTRSLSPLRSTSYDDDDDDDVKQLKSASCLDEDNHQKNDEKNEQPSSGLEATAVSVSVSASSSRSSSAGRSSKRWVFLKDFLYRSKSEGRSTNKFWSTISFSPVLKEKKFSNSTTTTASTFLQSPKDHQKEITNKASEHQISNNSSSKSKGSVKKPVNGIGKRRMPPSPHELHYTANRAQAEEMRKKTFLPYRQGLLGCLGFSSKGYGAMNGIARALNPVSSR